LENYHLILSLKCKKKKKHENNNNNTEIAILKMLTSYWMLLNNWSNLQRNIFNIRLLMAYINVSISIFFCVGRGIFLHTRL